jgi:hypothetical protein
VGEKEKKRKKMLGAESVLGKMNQQRKKKGERKKNKIRSRGAWDE